MNIARILKLTGDALIVVTFAIFILAIASMVVLMFANYCTLTFQQTVTGWCHSPAAQAAWNQLQQSTANNN